MVESFAFRTRARTIDHLGREQIADCPTAISELWKNSYDAYARNVALNIFDGDTPIATIADDGHGMSRSEFTERWLVVGTESKASESQTVEEDRNGLAPRTRQGQKGIGRLSSANLGPLLLVVSKRAGHRFVAALVDWRVFENPYLFLEDIEIPIVEFDQKHELLHLLPSLQDALMGNVWGRSGTVNTARDQRIALAWERLSAQETSKGQAQTTQSALEKTVIETAFEERHLSHWPLWKGASEHGTLLAISDIQFDLEAQLSTHIPEKDAAVVQARQQLLKTLSNFTDPFLNAEELAAGRGAPDFTATVAIHEGALHRSLIGEEAQFDLNDLESLEHVVLGGVDDIGVFRGRIKAFDNWLPGEVVIRPAVDVSNRSGSQTGPFDLKFGTFEQDYSKTSHDAAVFRQLEEQAKEYAGFYVYRNGLRVLPYGREGSDFFRIETRRTKHAGREFWSLRRLFGRVALRIQDNPNLRDKAGREGLIDNKAAKTFRDLVENILHTLALQYFGTDADLRKKIIPDRKEEHKKQQAQDARNKQRVQTRKLFRANLQRNIPTVVALKGDLEVLAEKVRASAKQDESTLRELRSALVLSKERFRETTLGEPPRNLGPLEEQYMAYRADFRHTKEIIDSLTVSLDDALERVNPKSAKEIALDELSANAAFLNKRLRAWGQHAKSLLESEQDRVSTLQAERSKAYNVKMLPVIDDVQQERISVRAASERFEAEKEQQDAENADLFEPYISALQSLKESIDLAGLAAFSQDQADELREEVDRLHGLAQLGITVEIIRHEIEGIEHSISSGLKEFPEEVKRSVAFTDVQSNYESLIGRLRFLAPLRLSGQKTRSQISGQQIYDYVGRFFGDSLSQQGIQLEASVAFIKFAVMEQPARIFPVFINLVNNAAYWVLHSPKGEKRILLDAIDGKVVVSDTGPGVDQDDIKNLFRLFFTRKMRGGRGVGLYLCRSNLAAGGHAISYETSHRWSTLSGAAFVIDFQAARYE